MSLVVCVFDNIDGSSNNASAIRRFFQYYFHSKHCRWRSGAGVRRLDELAARNKSAVGAGALAGDPDVGNTSGDSITPSV